MIPNGVLFSFFGFSNEASDFSLFLDVFRFLSRIRRISGQIIEIISARNGGKRRNKLSAKYPPMIGPAIWLVIHERLNMANAVALVSF